ncbi:hypothetical protein HRI96_10520 [Treponema parvum]|uniref:Uncharacterized protein n=1 Tax=Treponema parvum TaxID=138851 RepID=A0A975F1E8_9SPIR|nr:hypothetical protein [Treponema parvum]QTQ12592.1 hypothetical protein HRI96_10520 [Treponema parvum]
MNFVFINPVSKNMYDKRELNNFISAKGFEIVECKTDWIKKVINKYKQRVLSANKTVIDMRCPPAVQLVKNSFPKLDVRYPSIEPILIHCAKEISQNYADKGKIFITTPCESLAEYGNALNLQNTIFITWNDFAKKIGCGLKKTILSESPIPPGFFSPLKVKTKSITGSEEIQNFFEKEDVSGYKLIEMLYCKNGCNNGDGVL